MHKENREQIKQMQQHLQKSDVYWAENTKAIAEETKERNEQFCILSDKIAEESKERHRQFYELLRKLDERAN